MIACENPAPYLDGDPTRATTPAGERAACLDPIPPTGPLSIASLEQAVGHGDGIRLVRAQPHRLPRPQPHRRNLHVRRVVSPSMSVDIFPSPDTRYDPAAVDDPDDVGIDSTVDNCWLAGNPDQLNTDSDPVVTPGIAVADVTAPSGDSMGDVCDPDDGNDGILNFVEQTAGCNGSRPSPTLLATDGDRIADRAECLLNSDLVHPASRPARPLDDPDRDGLASDFEANTLGTDPNDPHSDDDGVRDGVEFLGYNTGPLDPDTDGDGCADLLEIVSLDSDFAVTSAGLLIVIMSNGATDRPNIDINMDGRIISGDALMVAMNMDLPACID